MSEPGPGEFRCARCGGAFESEWSHEEAMAEYEQAFTTEARDDAREEVCDDCYEAFMAWIREQHPDALRKGA